MYAVQRKGTSNSIRNFMTAEDRCIAVFTQKETAEEFLKNSCYCIKENMDQWSVVSIEALLSALDIRVYTG